MRHAESLLWIMSAAERLDAARAECRGAWSLAQICEHLALTIEATLRDPQSVPAPSSWRALGPLGRLRRTLLKHALLRTGRFPRGVPVPGGFAPTGTLSLSEAKERLRRAIVAFDEKLAQPGARWSLHPLLGRLSGRQWQRFHALHARHHLAYMSTDAAARLRDTAAPAR